ncbi:NADPH dehydrogenase NamA [Coprothermobacter platensis]|uniref:NADPH dehydrogenase NamA n=1 Tax=Coprothermobacter platensis TaxID=108819 RepID=UPI00036CF3B6|nr:NADPH dehydrogenase NamA [Coprothermobacter platensis]
MSKLFSPLQIKGLDLKNRIGMSPMCMYSAGDDGISTDWHFVHYGSRAVGGVGLIIQEATAVEKRGRITGNDLGLWDDSQITPLKKTVDFVHSVGCKMGVQLAHAGRKCEVKGEHIVGPSPIHWSNEYPTPEELTKDEIKNIVKAFGSAASRAVKVGYDTLEIHAAHGYLIHEFLSPLSNKRTDEYGGSRENRVRFLREVLEEVKGCIPQSMPIFMRVSATDFVEGGLDIDETVSIVNLVKDLVDVVDCSSGGLLSPRIDLYPGYQIGYAEAVKKSTGLLTAAVGLITSPELAEEIIGNGRADIVLLGRALLRQPYWPLYAAHELKANVAFPEQYERGKYL